MRNILLGVMVILAIFCWSGAACLDSFTGADGRTGGPGQPKSTLQIVEDSVGTIPLYGGIVSGILGIFGTVYNGLRAKSAKQDSLTMMGAWQALKDNWDKIADLKDLEVLIDNAAPTSAVAKRLSEQIDMLKAKGVI